MKIYTIYDSKIEGYTTPFFAPSELAAIRMFERAAMNPDHTMHTHPADFTLFEIGEWEEHSGEITPASVNRSVINALHLPFWASKENQQ